MKNEEEILLKQSRALPIISAVIAVALSFFIGVFVGEKNSNNNNVNNSSISSLSSTSLDKTTESMDEFWKVWSLLDQKFVGSTTPSTKEKKWGAIAGLTASYKDPYTMFFPPEESKSFAEAVAGNFEGIGAEIGIKDNQLVVVAPLKGTPAFKAGLLAGDKIYKIDGKPAGNLSVESAVKLIKGKKGTVVKISVVRQGAKDPIDIAIVRDTIDIPVVDTESRKDGIFIIRVYSFSAQSYLKFREAIREFIDSGDDKLIVDLRNNPGGYLEAAVDMASWFLPEGSLIVTENYGKSKPETAHTSKYGYNIFNDNLKMVILVNGGSASASEIFSGALHDHGKARLVGEKTFGKGSVQELINLDEGTSIKVTIAKWLTPNGISISQNGIMPDLEVKMTADDFQKNGDIQQQAAIDMLNKETATSSTKWILNRPQMRILE